MIAAALLLTIATLAVATAAPPAANRRAVDPETAAFELCLAEDEKCQRSAAYFIHTYVKINDKNRPKKGWFQFLLWPAQRYVLSLLLKHPKLLILKARQLGLTWLVLAYCLWRMLYEDGAMVMAFSRSDLEAQELVERVGGMHKALPLFLRRGVETDNAHELELSNGSRIMAFATTKHSGRSFTATVALIDEAWFIQWFQQLMNAVESTVNDSAVTAEEDASSAASTSSGQAEIDVIDDAAQIICITTADKEKPAHAFAVMFKKARANVGSWVAVFLPWWARPTRTRSWFAQLEAEKEQDDLWQEYPATVEQAMAARQASKRFRADWVAACAGSSEPLAEPPANAFGEPAPALPGLLIYTRPEFGRTYLVTADTSEGKKESDPTPIMAWDLETWEQVAVCYGVFEPVVQAGYALELSDYFHEATILPERNKDGGTFIATLRIDGHGDRLYRNPNDGDYGWLSNSKYKTLAVNKTAAALKDGSLAINHEATRLELIGIEAATLAAPEGDSDDLAMTVYLFVAGATWPTTGGAGGGMNVRL